MSTNTTATPAPVLPIIPGAALVNALLQWSEQDRLALAILLQDSVKEKFTSLEQAAKNDKELIRSRLQDLVDGKVELIEPEDVFAAMDEAIRKVRAE